MLKTPIESGQMFVSFFQELKAAGVPVLHYYTLGKPHVVCNVVKQL